MTPYHLPNQNGDQNRNIFEKVEECSPTDIELRWSKNNEILQRLFEDFSVLPELKKMTTDKGEEDIWGRNLTGKNEDWSGP